MIFDGLCNTEDWSNDADTEINYILHRIQIENTYFYC